MRRRDRTATLDAPQQRVVEPLDRIASAVGLVDDALQEYSRRELVSRVEVLGRLHRIENAVHDRPGGSEVIGIVDRLDRSWADQLVVSQAAVVDALLDVRSALVV